MRAIPFLFLCLTILAGCTAAASDEDLDRAKDRFEDARERADEKLEEARERVAEAREQVREAREEFRDATGSWSEDARREAKDALKEINGAWTEEVRREAEQTLEDLDLSETFGRVMEDIGLVLQDRAAVEVLEGSTLRDFLPANVAGMNLYNTDSDQSGGWGVEVSHSKGKYRSDAGDEMTLAIVDLGSLRGLASSTEEILESAASHDSRDDYRRTTTVDGHPALFQKRTHSRKTVFKGTVVVAKRFLIRMEAEGRGLEESIFEDVFDEIAISRLARHAR